MGGVCGLGEDGGSAGGGGCVVVIDKAMVQRHFYHSVVALHVEVPAMAGLYVMSLSCKWV
jgi:hypothetical protein